MKYSELIITDDNFDFELEKLSETVGIHFNNYDSFVKRLDDKFKCQVHPLGFDEWLIYEICPDIESGCRQAHKSGKLAYEFGNGFMVLEFDILL